MFGEAVNAVKSIQPIIMVLVASWPVLCLEMCPGLVQVTMVMFQVTMVMVLVTMVMIQVTIVMAQGTNGDGPDSHGDGSGNYAGLRWMPGPATEVADLDRAGWELRHRLRY